MYVYSILVTEDTFRFWLQQLNSVQIACTVNDFPNDYITASNCSLQDTAEH